MTKGVITFPKLSSPIRLEEARLPPARSGENFIFIKLVKQEELLYALSKQFSILNDGDLYDVLRVMRRIGELIRQQ